MKYFIQLIVLKSLLLCGFTIKLFKISWFTKVATVQYTIKNKANYNIKYLYFVCGVFDGWWAVDERDRLQDGLEPVAIGVRAVQVGYGQIGDGGAKGQFFLDP